MSDSPKYSRKQMIELVKAAMEHAKTEDVEKAELSPVDAVRAIGKAVKDQIASHQAELAKMRTLEVSTLKKNLMAPTEAVAAAGPAPSPEAVKTGAPLAKKNVFDIMKCGQPETMKGEDFIDLKNSNDPEKRLTDGNGPDTVVPSDKKPKKHDAPGSGGEISKDEMVEKADGVPEAPKPPQAPNAAPSMHKDESTDGEMDKAEFAAAQDRGQEHTYTRTRNSIHYHAKGSQDSKYLGEGKSAAHAQELINTHNKGNIHPDQFPALKRRPEQKRSMYKSEVTVFEVLAKGDFGMGDGGKVATTPAQLTAAPAKKPQFTMANLMAGKAALKPNTQALPNPSKPLAPTMEEHKQSQAASKKFGKAEFEGEECPYCKKPLSQCSCS